MKSLLPGGYRGDGTLDRIDVVIAGAERRDGGGGCCGECTVEIGPWTLGQNLVDSRAVGVKGFGSKRNEINRARYQ